MQWIVAAAGHYEDIAELCDEAEWPELAADYRQGEPPPDPSMTWVVIVDGQVVGFCDGNLEAYLMPEIEQRDHPSPQSWINFMAVASSHRNMRIGHYIVRQFSLLAQTEGRTYVGTNSDVHGDVDARIRFLTELGFNPLASDTYGAAIEILLEKTKPAQ